MQILKALFWPMAVAIPLAACGRLEQPPRPLPPAPYAYLSLTACRNYPRNITECQLEYGTSFGRHRLGPVQQVSRGLAPNLDGSRYRFLLAGRYPGSSGNCQILRAESIKDSQVPTPVPCWSKGEPLFVWLKFLAIETRSSIDGSRIGGRG